MKMELTENAYTRGLISIGNCNRIATFLHKLRTARQITYGAIGGSITEGAITSSQDLSYVSRFAKWLGGKTHCNLVNAGIGATDSLFGAYRVQEDLLAASPDVITIEFAVNDVCNPDTACSFEWLVRQCVSQPQKPLVILIFTMHRDGSNLQNIHIPIGRHYGLAMLSYRDAIYPEIETGKLSWPDISDDDVHPNDDGHGLISKMLIRFIESHEKTSMDCECGRPDMVLPCLLNKDSSRYFHGRVVDADTMNIISVDGWEKQRHEQKLKYIGLRADSPGATVVMEFECSTAIIGYRKYAGDYGKVSVCMDGRPLTTLDGFYEKPAIQKWAGGHTVLECLCNDSSPRKHKLSITLLADTHPDSHGHIFEIGYLLLS